MIAATGQCPEAVAGAALDLKSPEQLLPPDGLDIVQVYLGYLRIEGLGRVSFGVPNCKMQQEEADDHDEGETKECHASGIPADPMELRAPCGHPCWQAV